MEYVPIMHANGKTLFEKVTHEAAHQGNLLDLCCNIAKQPKLKSFINHFAHLYFCVSSDP